MAEVQQAIWDTRVGAKAKVRVTILGEDFTVKGEAEPDYIKRLASDVDSRMTKIYKASPRLARNSVAVLACLVMADELTRLRADYEELLKLVEAKE